MMKNNFLLESSDGIVLDKKIDKIISSTNFSNASKSSYDIEEKDLSDALEDLDTYSFLNDKKVIIIKNPFCNYNEKKFNHLLKYIDNPNPDNLLILVCEKLDSRLTATKKLKSNKNIEILKLEVNPYQYVKEVLKGYKIEENTINLLVEKCKSDITRLDSECNKLMLYKDNSKEITNTDVSNMVIEKLGESSEVLFSFVNSLLSKDTTNSFKYYKDLSRYNIDSNSIIGLVTSQTRLIYQVKTLADKGLSNELIKDTLGVKSVFQIKKIKNYIYQYSYKELANLISSLALVDLNIKSGKLDSNMAIDMLLINM